MNFLFSLISACLWGSSWYYLYLQKIIINRFHYLPKYSFRVFDPSDLISFIHCLLISFTGYLFPINVLRHIAQGYFLYDLVLELIHCYGSSSQKNQTLSQNTLHKMYVWHHLASFYLLEWLSKPDTIEAHLTTEIFITIERANIPLHLINILKSDPHTWIKISPSKIRLLYWWRFASFVLIKCCYVSYLALLALPKTDYLSSLLIIGLQIAVIHWTYRMGSNLR